MSWTASEGTLGWHRSQAWRLEELVPTGEWQQLWTAPVLLHLQLHGGTLLLIPARQAQGWLGTNLSWAFLNLHSNKCRSYLPPITLPCQALCPFVDALSHATDAQRIHSYAAPWACSSDFILTPLKYPPDTDGLTLLYKSLLLLFLSLQLKVLLLIFCGQQVRFIPNRRRLFLICPQGSVPCLYSGLYFAVFQKCKCYCVGSDWNLSSPSILSVAEGFWVARNPQINIHRPATPIPQSHQQQEHIWWLCPTALLFLLCSLHWL